LAEKKPLTGMRCEEFTQLASGGFEQPISFRNRIRMLWHKIECVYCRRFLAQLTRIRRLLISEPPVKAMPATMRDKIKMNLKD